MKKDRIANWFSNRNELLISEKIMYSVGSRISRKLIDKQTSNDLLLPEYFNTIDRAYTMPGRNVLYALLHAPLTEVDNITSRRIFIENLKKQTELRGKLKLLFWKVKFSPVHSINTVIFEKTESLFTREKMAVLIICFLFLVFAVPVLYSQFALYSILLFLLISFLTFARNLSIYNTHIPGLILLAAHFYTAQKIIKLFKTCEAYDSHIKNLEEALPQIKSVLRSCKVLRTGSFASADPLQLLLFWIKNIFCLDLLAYNNAVNIISRNRKAFINFYCCYGIIDALLSLSETIGSDTETICKPEFISNRGLSVKNIFHPLIPAAVSNSVDIGSGMILTGSNMAGKSTFLRTIGLNTILAQTTGYCYAEKFSLPLINIVSIINKHDNLNQGESFYFYEANRIVEMINNKNNDCYLFLIDELLSGTNSIERISASTAIIRHLVSRENIISIIATHDISIAENLQGNCECFYFSDMMNENRMYFDYKLRKGIIKTTNAIKMLKLLGMPVDITDEAEMLT